MQDQRQSHLNVLGKHITMVTNAALPVALEAPVIQKVLHIATKLEKAASGRGMRGRARSWGLVKSGSCQGYGLKRHCMAPPSDHVDLLFYAQTSEVSPQNDASCASRTANHVWQPHRLSVNQRHVHLVGIKYCEDMRPGQQMEAAQRQHADLCKNMWKSCHKNDLTGRAAAALSWLAVVLREALLQSRLVEPTMTKGAMNFSPDPHLSLLADPGVGAPRNLACTCKDKESTAVSV
eukprot:1145492-Pelagomonas_calceolata.AAC.1